MSFFPKDICNCLPTDYKMLENLKEKKCETRCSFPSLSDIVEVPEVDMIFAISANAQLNELANFRQMKDIINAMIDKYGRGDIMYAVIVYGDEPSRLVRFTTNFDSDEALMDYISKMRKGRGASLTKALQLAKEVNNVRDGPNKA